MSAYIYPAAASECPACHEQALPILRDSTATAVCCQNPRCLTVVDREGRIVGLHPDWEHVPGSGIRRRLRSPNLEPAAVAPK